MGLFKISTKYKKKLLFREPTFPSLLLSKLKAELKVDLVLSKQLSNQPRG